MIKKLVNRKNLVIGGIIGCVVIIIAIIAMLVSNPKAKLTRSLEKMGKDFYENFHSELSKGKTQDMVKEELSKYLNMGIRLNLDGLNKFDEKNEKAIKKFKYKGKDCDRVKTEVAIFPKEPYGIKDYTIETTLECGFKS